MTGRIVGAIFVLFSCGATGFQIAIHAHREAHNLRQLIRILDYMENELACKCTPLPDLCRQIAENTPGILGRFFQAVSAELESKNCPNAAACIHRQTEQLENLPGNTADTLHLLGDFLGRFDLQGQLRGIDSVRNECIRKLDELTKDLSERTHRYKTLGLCAGAALIILFI